VADLAKEEMHPRGEKQLHSAFRNYVPSVRALGRSTSEDFKQQVADGADASAKNVQGKLGQVLTRGLSTEFAAAPSPKSIKACIRAAKK
jgi:hypothetical protein